MKRVTPPSGSVELATNTFISLHFSTTSHLIGLRRHGFSSEEIHALKSAYKLIWRSNQERNEVMQQVETELGHFPQVMKLLEFIRASKRGTITPERI